MVWKSPEKRELFWFQPTVTSGANPAEKSFINKVLDVSMSGQDICIWFYSAEIQTTIQESDSSFVQMY